MPFFKTACVELPKHNDANHGGLMTHKTLKALLLSAFISLAACAGDGSNPSDYEHLNDDSNKLVSGETDEDSTEEGLFDDASQPENDITLEDVPENDLTSSSEASILARYNHLDPNREVSTSALKKAILYFDKNKAKIKNKEYLSLIDFSKSSSRKRLFIINMSSGKVWALHVAHGKGSDSNHDGYAEKFSNVPNSKASSLGYYLTGSTYQGSNGYSLKMDGLSSTNSKARGRAIVIHGAKYVRQSDVKQGRSWGCPAVAWELRTTVINMLKGGSLIYAFN